MTLAKAAIMATKATVFVFSTVLSLTQISNEKSVRIANNLSPVNTQSDQQKRWGTVWNCGVIFFYSPPYLKELSWVNMFGVLFVVGDLKGYVWVGCLVLCSFCGFLVAV